MKHPWTVIWAILLLLLICIFPACTFNKIFLHPTEMTTESGEVTVHAGSDTVTVHFNQDTFQPVFRKNGSPMEMDYTIESVVFESTSGNKLNGWFLKPVGIKPAVTLLHFHGNAGWLLTQFRAIAPLIKYGFQIFIIDYSGFGFSEGKATRNNVLEDGLSSLSFLKKRPEIAGTNLVIYGQSLGGHLAGVVATMRESEIDGVVIEGAFSSHRDIAECSAGFIGRTIVTEGYSARDSLKNFNKPVLIIHSREDKTVPFELGQKLFENANQPKEFYQIDKCHICGPKFYADSISEKILKMVRADAYGNK